MPGGPPVIDPTKLTTDAVQGAKDDFRREIAAMRELLEQRLNAMDQATTLQLHAFEDIPKSVEVRLAALRDTLDEKFRGIERQFAERDIRSEQDKKASKEALDAALLALTAEDPTDAG